MILTILGLLVSHGVLNGMKKFGFVPLYPRVSELEISGVQYFRNGQGVVQD